MKMRSTTRRFATKGKLRMPLAPTSRLGRAIADDIRFVASDVTAVVIPNSRYWLMEEQPTATIAAVSAFLDQTN